MADVQTRWCNAAILCIVLIILAAPAVGAPGGMDRDLIDPCDGIGKGRAIWQGRGIKIQIHYTEVDTLVVNIDYSVTDPQVLRVKRIPGKQQVHPTDARKADERIHRGREGEKAQKSPLRRMATAWAVLRGLARLTVAIISILLF